VKENSDKNVYYIDGDVSPKDREMMINAMEDDDSGNTVIVASIGCFSEGIDICNLWNIFLVETTKSDNLLRQILGRGMRQYEGKEKTMFIDIIDDFRYDIKGNSGNSVSKYDYFSENYLYKHGMERRQIYENKGFPYKILHVKLENKLFE
jgi:superfamily II DNA or RNA helicase